MSKESKRTSWSHQVDLSVALAGGSPPAPRVGRWKDGKEQRALFYPNEVHSVFGDPESMKSWLLLFAAVDEIKQGNHVFFVDMEASDRSIVDRLVSLGADSSAIKRRFHYFRPDERMNEFDQAKLRSLVQKHKPSLVVLDGVTEAFAVHSLSINSAEDAASWFRLFARQMQVQPSTDYDGPAIVELDHVVKNHEARNGWALGTIHKKAGIKGAAYQVVAVRPFGKGKHGVSRLFLEKDSPGGVDWKPYGVKDRRRLVGELNCDATGEDGIDAWIEPPNADAVADGPELPLVETFEFRLLMQSVNTFVANNPGCTTRLVRGSVAGTFARIQSALEVLVADGYVVNEGKGRGHKYRSVKDFTAMKVMPGGGSS